jgi:hypothetical protein
LREPVDQVVLAAVRFIGDNDDVVTLREQGCSSGFAFGREL